MTVIKDKFTCKTCAYFNWVDTDKGQCHRYPPQLLLTPEQKILGRFPFVDSDFWCGEWDSDSPTEEEN